MRQDPQSRWLVACLVGILLTIARGRVQARDNCVYDDITGSTAQLLGETSIKRFSATSTEGCTATYTGKQALSISGTREQVKAIMQAYADDKTSDQMGFWSKSGGQFALILTITTTNGLSINQVYQDVEATLPEAGAVDFVVSDPNKLLIWDNDDIPDNYTTDFTDLNLQVATSNTLAAGLEKYDWFPMIDSISYADTSRVYGIEVEAGQHLAYTNPTASLGEVIADLQSVDVSYGYQVIADERYQFSVDEDNNLSTVALTTNSLSEALTTRDQLAGDNFATVKLSLDNAAITSLQGSWVTLADSLTQDQALDAISGTQHDFQAVQADQLGVEVVQGQIQTVTLNNSTAQIAQAVATFDQVATDNSTVQVKLAPDVTQPDDYTYVVTQDSSGTTQVTAHGTDQSITRVLADLGTLGSDDDFLVGTTDYTLTIEDGEIVEVKLKNLTDLAQLDTLTSAIGNDDLKVTLADEQGIVAQVSRSGEQTIVTTQSGASLAQVLDLIAELGTPDNLQVAISDHPDIASVSVSDGQIVVKLQPGQTLLDAADDVNEVGSQYTYQVITADEADSLQVTKDEGVTAVDLTSGSTIGSVVQLFTALDETVRDDELAITARTAAGTEFSVSKEGEHFTATTDGTLSQIQTMIADAPDGTLVKGNLDGRSYAGTVTDGQISAVALTGVTLDEALTTLTALHALDSHVTTATITDSTVIETITTDGTKNEVQLYDDQTLAAALTQLAGVSDSHRPQTIISLTDNDEFTVSEVDGQVTAGFSGPLAEALTYVSANLDQDYQGVFVVGELTVAAGQITTAQTLSDTIAAAISDQQSLTAANGGAEVPLTIWTDADSQQTLYTLTHEAATGYTVLVNTAQTSVTAELAHLGDVGSVTTEPVIITDGSTSVTLTNGQVVGVAAPSLTSFTAGVELHAAIAAATGQSDFVVPVTTSGGVSGEVSSESGVGTVVTLTAETAIADLAAALTPADNFVVRGQRDGAAYELTVVNGQIVAATSAQTDLAAALELFDELAAVAPATVLTLTDQPVASQISAQGDDRVVGLQSGVDLATAVAAYEALPDKSHTVMVPASADPDAIITQISQDSGTTILTMAPEQTPATADATLQTIATPFTAVFAAGQLDYVAGQPTAAQLPAGTTIATAVAFQQTLTAAEHDLEATVAGDADYPGYTLSGTAHDYTITPTDLTQSTAVAALLGDTGPVSDILDGVIKGPNYDLQLQAGEIVEADLKGDLSMAEAVAVYKQLAALYPDLEIADIGSCVVDVIKCSQPAEVKMDEDQTLSATVTAITDLPADETALLVAGTNYTLAVTGNQLTSVQLLSVDDFDQAIASYEAANVNQPVGQKATTTVTDENSVIATVSERTPDSASPADKVVTLKTGADVATALAEYARSSYRDSTLLMAASGDATSPLQSAQTATITPAGEQVEVVAATLTNSLTAGEVVDQALAAVAANPTADLELTNDQADITIIGGQIVAVVLPAGTSVAEALSLEQTLHEAGHDVSVVIGSGETAITVNRDEQGRQQVVFPVGTSEDRIESALAGTTGELVVKIGDRQLSVRNGQIVRPATSQSSGAGLSTPSNQNVPNHARAEDAAAKTCPAQRPVGSADLFQIDRRGREATLYFTPVKDYTNGYHVIYGHAAGDERYGGIALPTTDHSGVLTITIHDLDPNAQYSFTVAPVNDCAVGDWSNWLTSSRVNAASNYWTRTYRY